MMYIKLLIIIFPSEGFSGGSQSSVAGYGQLSFPAASQSYLTSGAEGRLETSVEQSQQSYHMTFTKKVAVLEKKR